MPRRFFFSALLTALVALSFGCQQPLRFPMDDEPSAAETAGAFRAFDTGAKGLAGFFLFANPEGRIDRIGYGRSTAAGPSDIVSLDAIPLDQRRHLVIILDGFGYDVVRQAYNEGRLRMFYPPSKVLAPYPTMSDMSIEDLLGDIPVQGFEALYYDRLANRLKGGSMAYLAGHNQPYNRLLDYRASLILDAYGYIRPYTMFADELNDTQREFDRNRQRETLAYLVSSAGISTRYGADGQRVALEQVERLVHQALYETRGLVAVTLMADHGHGYAPAERLPVERFLKEKGWRVRNRLDRPEDVVYPRFGLTTYASFSTLRPEALASDLTELDGVELVSFVEGEAVVALAGGGARAVIRHRHGRYAYDAQQGDPLNYRKVLDGLQPDAEGYYDGDALFAATLDHTYPDALARLWRAHFALVEQPADVIASLADNVYSGSGGFDWMFPIASTHGSLNRNNSLTFVMSTAGPLPEALRARDVPQALSDLFERPWPLKASGAIPAP